MTERSCKALSISKVNLNEIIYRFKDIQNPLMLKIVEVLLIEYDELISELLSQTKVYPSKSRKGLGRHIRRGDSKGRLCRGRKIRKRGYRQVPRKIKTIFGELHLRLRVAECCRCGTRYSPLLRALQIERYVRKEVNFEHEVIEAVIDTNYRRLVDGRSIDISLGGIHNIVAGSDIDAVCQETISPKKLSAIMADGTGVKQYRGRKGELRAVVGISQAGRVMPLGCFTNTSWPDVERTVKQRI